MDDPNALFSQYENEYCNKSTDISRKINTASTLSGDARRKKLSEVDVDIREADNIIKKMDMEARSVAPERSRNLQNKVKEYKADLASLKEQLTKARSTAGDFESARAELGLGMDYASSSQAQRDRMLSGTAKLEQSNERLQTGKKLLAETEELGTGILANLAAQRETIIHSRDTLHGADDNISKARKILSNMSRVMLQNKLILIGVIAFLLTAIILIIYFKAK
ncbi:hypothetical protein GPECTOR_22g911 [Gonium pectorale]|uniref:t-SNARE coiled-coil homology domain-containing protein n=1 Tax=Gonium pectorale TaxID=33097 RepID=A0A150GHM9_GONPE|nr:hypothetical protein GPECTOR_22g911 [Gonium pectorale]|eukprot:KXZ49317.1 hypothetical protein GPECTOR_22g911 [Gonium pectorale]